MSSPLLPLVPCGYSGEHAQVLWLVQSRHLSTRLGPGNQEHMAEFSNDDTRLRVEEEQMRRALGLREPASPPAGPAQIRPAPNGSPRPHRRFIRDGEVPVEVVHHEGGGINQLDAARQANRALATARDQAERQLAEAQTAIRDLETKLAHERLARDEAAQRAAAEREGNEKALHSAREGLDAECAARRVTEEQLAAALKRCTEAERRVEELMRSIQRQESAKPNGAHDHRAEAAERIAVPGRRRGRPRKNPEPESETEFVEWWKPGWKQQFR